MACEKHGFRQELRGRRRDLRPDLRRRGAVRIAHRGHLLLRRAARVAAYLPHGSELDPRPLMSALERAGCALYLPVVNRRPHSPLAFLPWRASLTPNRYGIMEPRWGRRLQGSQLDAVLVPVVGFDARGLRLGQGGGHYDRTFAFLSRKKHSKPLLIGLAFECQRVGKLPNDAHDVRLHAVLTEKRLYGPRRML